MDVFGDHVLVRACLGDQIKRHNAPRNQCVFDALLAGHAGRSWSAWGCYPSAPPGRPPLEGSSRAGPGGRQRPPPRRRLPAQVA